MGMDHLRLAILGLAAAALLILGWSLIEQALRTDQRPSPSPLVADAHVPAQDDQSRAAIEARAEIRQKIEAQLAQSPDYMRFFDRLKLVFPTEYETIIDSFAKHALATGETEDIDAMMSQAVRALRLSHGVLAAKADGPALQKIFAVQLTMMRALAAKDQRLCVDFLYGGASRAFFNFSAENRALVADMALAGLEAISNGQAHKIDRQEPNEGDFEVLERALREQGLNTAEIEALLDGKAADPPIIEARMCRVGQTYLETLTSLPEATRYRLYGLAVELMARS